MDSVQHPMARYWFGLLFLLVKTAVGGPESEVEALRNRLLPHLVNDSSMCERLLHKLFPRPNRTEHDGLDGKVPRWLPGNLWRRADSIGIGYPAALKSYVRLLALSITGSLDITPIHPMEPMRRWCGLDWPREGFSMVGLLRLRNVADLLLDVVSNKIPGDFVDLGVWRGGISMFARGLFNALESKDRLVHLFDAFDLMVPDYEPEQRKLLAVSPKTIKGWFEMLGIGHQDVVIHRGLLSDTLPPFHRKHRNSSFQISVLRVDVNWYDPHQDALYYLYEFVPIGGYVIFDDVRLMPRITQFWADFQQDQAFTEELVAIDAFSAYFRKTKKVTIDFGKMRTSNESSRAKKE